MSDLDKPATDDMLEDEYWSMMDGLEAYQAIPRYIARIKEQDAEIERLCTATGAARRWRRGKRVLLEAGVDTDSE